MADKRVNLPRVTKVKNKAPAPVQITAEQILRGAVEGQIVEEKAPESKITDPQELEEYKLRKRKDFEDIIRRNRIVISKWLYYAKWEESQNEFERARSIYERALDVDHRNVQIWLKYVMMEQKHGNVNHARNLFDRAVTILPRVEQFWYKYVLMEETLGNIAGCRQVFERWMEWEPDLQAWQSFVNFEQRYGEVDRCRVVYRRLLQVHPEVGNWLKFARFEERQSGGGGVAGARDVFSQALEFFGDECVGEELLIGFAQFEERHKEIERARAIYKYGLDLLRGRQQGGGEVGKNNSGDELYRQYTIFEKKHGDKSGVENVVLMKRRKVYEEEVGANPRNYDAWFDYVRMMEEKLADDEKSNNSVAVVGDDEGADSAKKKNMEAVRRVYERAVVQVPLVEEKRYWRRYIYLWIYYALFEELVAKDPAQTRAVYRRCLDVVPHRSFTFAKVWLLYAMFEIRQLDIGAARKALGLALGKCGKDKLFREYITLETQLYEFDRCRKLYEKYIEFNPSNCQTWLRFAKLEDELGETVRARAIYELSVNQELLDMPELLWKNFIDFEVSHGENDRARELFERLLEKTDHVKVWCSFAEFEMEKGKSAEKARKVYARADEALKKKGDKAQRNEILEKWLEFELGLVSGSDISKENLEMVEGKQAKRVKKRRQLVNEDGSEGGWEEYFDFIFPDENTAAPNMKLLQMAHLWKKKQNQ
eukprot:Nk52_evm1s307 gene=Nk52_evmTU1s307